MKYRVDYYDRTGSKWIEYGRYATKREAHRVVASLKTTGNTCRVEYDSSATEVTSEFHPAQA